MFPLIITEFLALTFYQICTKSFSFFWGTGIRDWTKSTENFCPHLIFKNQISGLVIKCLGSSIYILFIVYPVLPNVRILTTPLLYNYFSGNKSNKNRIIQMHINLKRKRTIWQDHFVRVWKLILRWGGVQQIRTPVKLTFHKWHWSSYPGFDLFLLSE